MDVEKIRRDFPILAKRINGKKLAYLDNAASTQKPRQVLDAVSGFYTRSYSNVHRSVSSLAMEATEKFEEARRKVAGFVGGEPEETIFTRNATESLNLVAYAWGDANVQKGDAVVVTEMDHHSNFVPWQQLALRKKASFHVVPVDENGELGAFDFPKNTKVFAFPHASNVLGTVNDVRKWVKKAKKAGATVVVDGAAAAPHLKVDVGALGADFYAFSGHKMLGLMGSGVLWGKGEVLEQTPPFLFGGSMISSVGRQRTKWVEPPQKFEAGTPNAADAVGLGAAIGYLEKIGSAQMQKHEEKLTRKAISLLSEIEGVTIYGKPKERVGIVSFNLAGVHAHDLGSVLDAEGVAIRSGHHCAQPLVERLGVPATARASFYLYNTEEEVERLAKSVKKAKRIFS